MTDLKVEARLSSITRHLADMAADGTDHLDGYINLSDVYWLVGEIRRLLVFGDIVPHTEVADILGIQPNSVRKRMRRHGISEVRGYPRALVLRLQRRKLGHSPTRGEVEV